MSQSDEILESTPTTYMVDYEYEPHIIINDDRTITIPEELVHIAVRGDHNIETVTFDCPRYWDNHDLSAMKIQINYRRPDGRIDPYPVKNIRVDEVDDSQIHFDWTISGNVTEIKGNISFTVCAKLSDEEGNRELEWHSRMSHGLIIDDSLDCSGEELAKQYPDIIESISAQLDNLKNTGGVSNEQVANAVEAYMADHPIDDIDLTGYATESWVQWGYQPKGEYLTEVPEDYAKIKDIPKKPEDIGALPDTYTPPNQTAEQVGADPKGSAASAMREHNVDTDAHNDLRVELKALSDRLTAFFDSDDNTLDKLSEIVDYITSNKTLIESITISKVDVADIIDNLTTNVANQPLSAAQGVVLKGLIDTLNTRLSNYTLTSELPIAVNTALAQAKKSGEFDGTSPTVNVSAITGGHRIAMTDANGMKSIDVMDGSSVTIKSVTESTIDGGSNIITFSDGTIVSIKNGSKGDVGPRGYKGDSGYTPQKGIDYWTEDEKAEIVDDVLMQIDSIYESTWEASY